jgi:hypothetical protein
LEDCRRAASALCTGRAGEVDLDMIASSLAKPLSHLVCEISTGDSGKRKGDINGKCLAGLLTSSGEVVELLE